MKRTSLCHLHVWRKVAVQGRSWAALLFPISMSRSVFVSVCFARCRFALVVFVYHLMCPTMTLELCPGRARPSLRCPPVPNSYVQHWVWPSKAQLELRELLAKGCAWLCQKQVRSIVPGVCVTVLQEVRCIREYHGMNADAVSELSGDMFFSMGQSIAKATVCSIA